MIDTGTGLTALGLALGGKDIVVKLLGPTAEYLGDEAKEFTKKRFENVKNIFSNAALKLGERLNTEKGSVPPKVLKGIINEGSYCDDFLAIEYFGGVLASSRTGISRDDRGAYFNSLVSRLSTYQLRLHYLLYHVVKSTFDEEDINVGIDTERNKLRVFIPFDSYSISMDFTGKEMQEFENILNHSILGLLKESLIDNFYQFGGVDFISKEFPSADKPGIILQPSPIGIELFLWAYGHGQNSIRDYLTDKVKFDIDEKIKIINTNRRITEKKAE